MQLLAPLPTLLHRDRVVRTRPSVLRALARAKRSGGPEDRALYNCSCGYVFKADVSTSVGCPQCGTSQAW
jgi:hypothetical protein